ncbi:MAG: HEPN domain-containing protein [Nitrospirae bacterium]|nr:HEPN domain-containing protein [Nitrospirota bacterium]
MILEPKDKITLSNIRMDKAHEFFAEARANLEKDRIKTAVNRSYYSAFNAVRALLILEGINHESHDGAVTMLSLRFVKPGLLPVYIIKKFKVLLSQRTDVDYGDFETVDAADSADAVKTAGDIIETIDNLRVSLIKDISKPSTP